MNDDDIVPPPGGRLKSHTLPPYLSGPMHLDDRDDWEDGLQQTPHLMKNKPGLLTLTLPMPATMVID